MVTRTVSIPFRCQSCPDHCITSGRQRALQILGIRLCSFPDLNHYIDYTTSLNLTSGSVTRHKSIPFALQSHLCPLLCVSNLGLPSGSLSREQLDGWFPFRYGCQNTLLHRSASAFISVERCIPSETCSPVSSQQCLLRRL